MSIVLQIDYNSNNNQMKNFHDLKKSLCTTGANSKGLSSSWSINSMFIIEDGSLYILDLILVAAHQRPSLNKIPYISNWAQLQTLVIKSLYCCILLNVFMLSPLVYGTHCKRILKNFNIILHFLEHIKNMHNHSIVC